MVLKESNHKDKTKSSIVEPVDSLIDLVTVQTQIHKGKSWIYKEIGLGNFPAPHKLGRSSLWSQNDLNSFILNLTSKAKEGQK